MLPGLVIPWVDDCRTRRIAQLLMVLWLLGLADLFFTVWAHRFTPFYEMNPLARGLLDTTGMLVLFKLSLTALGTVIFWTLRKHARAEMALWGIVAVYVALTFRWSDYTSAVLIMMPPTM